MRPGDDRRAEPDEPPRRSTVKVKDVMSREPRTCTCGSSLNDAARILWEADCGIVPIVEADGSDRLIGIVTDRDVCMAAYTTGLSLKEIPVDRAMTTTLHGCSAEDPVGTSEAIMQQQQVRRLPVVDGDGCLQGIVSLADLALVAAADHAKKRPRVTPRQIVLTLGAISRPRESHEGDVEPAKKAAPRREV